MCIPQTMNIDRGASDCNASRTNMDAPTRKLYYNTSNNTLFFIQKSYLPNLNKA
jgi:hypothetical protein